MALSGALLLAWCQADVTPMETPGAGLVRKPASVLGKETDATAWLGEEMATASGDKVELANSRDFFLTLYD